jgi:hypothetical protein
MKRNAAALVLVALGGCMSTTDHRPGLPSAGGCPGRYGIVRPPPIVPGLQSASGERVPMAQPYAMSPPANNYLAYQMMGRHLPMDMVRTSTNPTADPGVVQAAYHGPAGGLIAPPGAPFGPPPLTLPGNSMPAVPPPGFVPPPGAVAAVGAMTGDGGANPFPVKRTQVRFAQPSGMKVAWLVAGPDGRPIYSPTVLETPGRYNFAQAAIYRLKLSNIEGRPGLEVYPTLEVVPANHKTEAFLAHSAVPIEFTDADFNQIAAGNYVVKVIYLPDPQFQELAAAGIGSISSTQLDPGADPIVEALRRGSILLVLRMGNMDQEAPNTPPIDAPAGNCPVGISPLMPPVPGAANGPATPAGLRPTPGGPGPGSTIPAAAPPRTVPPPGPTSRGSDAAPVQQAAGSTPLPPPPPPRTALPAVPPPADFAVPTDGGAKR